MKKLFDDLRIAEGKSDWTEEAGQLSIDIEKALSPIVNAYIKEGYSVREIEYVIMSTATGLGARKSLEKMVSSHKAREKIKKDMKCL